MNAKLDARRAWLSPPGLRRAATLIAGWLVVGLTGASCPAGEAMTPEHVARIRDVSAARISPDGHYVAYTVRVPRVAEEDEDGAAWCELHVFDPGTGITRAFVAGRVNIEHFEWTANSTALWFTAKLPDDEHVSLYRIAIDGGAAQRMITFDEDIGEFSGSPAGDRIAFLAKEPETEAREEQRKTGFKQEIFEEDWRRTRVYVANADGQSPPQAVELLGSASAIAWRPDGTRIAVAVAPTPGPDAQMMFSRIRLLDAQTLAVVGDIITAGKIGEFVFSPDSKRIALIAAADINDPQEGRLFVGGANGGALSELLPNLAGHVRGLAWQNAETIAFLTHEGCYSTYGKVTSDAKAGKRMVGVGRPPVLYSLSGTADGRAAAFVADAPSHPAEVYYIKQGDAAPRRLTDSNPWLAQIELAKQEVVRYKARDDLEIEGLLIYPLNHDPAQQYPLVVIVHGGPEAHVSDGWLTTHSRPGQVLAARGFAVFYPNYRASTGRGVAFSQLDHRDMAGKEFNDIVDGVEHLVQAGLVDRARVGVTGGSYGGYATAWCSTALTEHFAAGVMAVGLSDLTSFFGTTDIPYEMNLVHARVWPWEDPAFFAERSPITYAKQARTPLLIMHGKADERVHPSQSMELYRYLRTLGKPPVRLVLYPGEGHGNNKAAARYDFSLRLVQWMEHYLKAPDRRDASPPEYELEYKLHWKAGDDKKEND